MPRTQGVFNTAIWNDDDWLDLPPLAQHLYFVLWTHPGLTYCGTLEWHPGRLSKRAGGWTSEAVETAGACLQSRHFIVVDTETDEALIRSWARFDGLLKQPNLAVSFANAYGAVSSRAIRGVLVHEAKRIKKESPEFAAWGKAAVAHLLSQNDIDPRALPIPDDPWLTPNLTPTLTPPLTLNRGVGVDPPSDPPSTPSPSPTPSPHVQDADASGDALASRRKPETAIPDGWAPNAKHFAQAEEKRVDIQAEARAFRNHAETHDRRARNWDAAFRNWLDKAKPTTATPGTSAWDRPGVTERRIRGEL